MQTCLQCVSVCDPGGSVSSRMTVTVWLGRRQTKLFCCGKIFLDTHWVWKHRERYAHTHTHSEVQQICVQEVVWGGEHSPATCTLCAEVIKLRPQGGKKVTEHRVSLTTAVNKHVLSPKYNHVDNHMLHWNCEELVVILSGSKPK